MTAAGGLGAKLGPVLFQLPPTLTADASGTGRGAVRARRPGQGRGRPAPSVLVGRADPPTRPSRRGVVLGGPGRAAGDAVVADGELRLPTMRHGAPPAQTAVRASAIRSWVDRVASTWTDEPVYVFFNNDHGGAAIVDASAFAATAARRGLPVSPPRIRFDRASSDGGAMQTDQPGAALAPGRWSACCTLARWERRWARR
jgi:hypothetical protein